MQPTHPYKGLLATRTHYNIRTVCYTHKQNSGLSNQAILSFHLQGINPMPADGRPSTPVPATPTVTMLQGNDSAFLG